MRCFCCICARLSVSSPFHRHTVPFVPLFQLSRCPVSLTVTFVRPSSCPDFPTLILSSHLSDCPAFAFFIVVFFPLYRATDTVFPLFQLSRCPDSPTLVLSSHLSDCPAFPLFSFFLVVFFPLYCPTDSVFPLFQLYRYPIYPTVPLSHFSSCLAIPFIQCPTDLVFPIILLSHLSNLLHLFYCPLVFLFPFLCLSFSFRDI